MKIALVHYAASPVIGGVERVMDEHARLFARSGHEVTVFCQRGGIASDGVRIVPLAENAAALLAEQDIVFVHNVLTMPFDLPLTATLRDFANRASRTRVVAWTHDVAAANPDLAPVPPMLREAAQSSPRVPSRFSNPREAASRVEWVAVSELRRRELREHLGVEKCRVIPNGVDPSRVLGLPENVRVFAERHGLLDGRLAFLHPTRLLRRKNVELGFGIVKALGDAKLIITGAEDPHNPSSASYSQKLRELASDSVIFASDHFAVGDAELAALYRIADVLMFPSRQEGFGLPLIEARLHRLPAVYSRIEPLDEIAGDMSFPISLDEEPSAIAARLAPWLAANPHICDRQIALAQFSWPAIYRRHLVPLLDAPLDSPDK